MPPNAGKGRPKGVPNKITTDMRAAMVEAFDENGGVAYLSKLAKKNPALFVHMLAKLIPTEVKGAITGSINYIIDTGVPEATDD